MSANGYSALFAIRRAASPVSHTEGLGARDAASLIIGWDVLLEERREAYAFE